MADSGEKVCGKVCVEFVLPTVVALVLTNVTVIGLLAEIISPERGADSSSPPFHLSLRNKDSNHAQALFGCRLGSSGLSASNNFAKGAGRL